MIYKLSGKAPTIHSTAFIAPGAHIIGDVVIEEDASVWFNAVLRGDMDTITIGKGSNIQDGTVIHVDGDTPVKVGNNVTVGHNVTLHGCTLEDGVLIGMGASVLNRAVIGEGSIVAAGALIPEGKVVEPGVLVAGVPARVVRKLSEELIERIKYGAKHYVENGREYVKNLEVIDGKSSGVIKN